MGHFQYNLSILLGKLKICGPPTPQAFNSFTPLAPRMHSKTSPYLVIPFLVHLPSIGHPALRISLRSRLSRPSNVARVFTHLRVPQCTHTFHLSPTPTCTLPQYHSKPPNSQLGMDSIGTTIPDASATIHSVAAAGTLPAWIGNYTGAWLEGSFLQTIFSSPHASTTNGARTPSS